MNDQSNTPMSSEPAQSTGISGWISTWIKAVTKPNEQTFATMAEHPDAQSVWRAFIWVFIAGTVSAIISPILGRILDLAGFPSLTSILGGSSDFGSVLISILKSPISGAVEVLEFAIAVGIIQWMAKMFKGTGIYSRLAYTMAAVLVPFTIILSFLAPFVAIFGNPFLFFFVFISNPSSERSSYIFLGICLGLFILVLYIYALVLYVMAVKGVNKFRWGQAIGSVLVCGIFVVIFQSLLGLLLYTFHSY